jgi:MerR family transcriptional regulator, light-induced transcriptional regulator
MNQALSLSVVYHRYIEALLHGSYRRALRVCQAALNTGTTLNQLYLEVFHPALYEIGQLWERNRLSIAQEHIATAITRTVMAQVHAIAASRLSTRSLFVSALNRKIITTCVSGEYHDIGIRMVADCFEIEGWRVYHLGANMPADDVVHLANHEQVHVLALSVTLNVHVPDAYEIIRQVRRSPIGSRIKVLVGGQPFNQVEGLYQKVEADLTAANACEAVYRTTAALSNQHADHEGHSLAQVLSLRSRSVGHGD